MCAPISPEPCPTPTRTPAPSTSAAAPPCSTCGSRLPTGRTPGDPAAARPRRPRPLATVQPTGFGSGESDLAALYPAIHQRHSSRFPFEETKIPEAVRTALSDAAHLEGASLSFATAWHLDEVLELVEEAEARNRTDRGSDEDLAAWTRIGTPSVMSAADGVPEYAFGPRKRGGKAPVRDFAGARSVAGRTATASNAPPNSPSSAPLATARRTGGVLVRPWSACCCWPPSKVCPARSVTQALEWPDLRWPLRDPLSGSAHVQMVLRLGDGPGAPAHHAARYRRYSTSSPEVGSALDVHDTFQGPDETCVMARTRHAAFSAEHFGLRTVDPARSAVPVPSGPERPTAA